MAALVDLRRLGGGLLGPLVECAADVDEIVGDDAEPDPPFHSGLALVAATVKAVSAFGDADAALASGAPFLAVAEPALLLLASAFGTLGGTVGDEMRLTPLDFAAASFLLE